MSSLTDKFKVIGRTILDYPIRLCFGDSIALTVTDEATGTKTLLTKVFDRSRTITECVVIEGEFEGRGAVGGLFLEAR